MVPRTKKKNKYSKEYMEGRQRGECDTLELIGALLMQDYGWSVSDLEKFCTRLSDWQSYINEPNLPFYISTVKKINQENGLKFRRTK